MALSNFVNTTDFYTYTGLSSSDINSDYLSFLITKFNAAIDQKLKPVFELSRSQTIKYHPDNSGRIVFLGNWQPSGVVDSITVTNGGTGYTSTPTITILGSGGATATANISGGVITSIEITNQGKGYTTAPTIIISGGNGSNATATATISTLTVKIGQEGSTDLTTLTEGNDYRLLRWKGKNEEPGRTYPYSSVKLYDRWLSGRISNEEYVQMEGTYGFSPSVPAELNLDIKIYNILKKITLNDDIETSTGGRGSIKSAKIDKISTTFGGVEESGALTIDQGLSKMDNLLDNLANEYTDDGTLEPQIIG